MKYAQFSSLFFLIRMHFPSFDLIRFTNNTDFIFCFSSNLEYLDIFLHNLQAIQDSTIT